MIGAQLQKAIYSALTSAPPLADGRVFDGVPRGESFPQITIGDEQVMGDDNACSQAWEAYVDVHVWSRPAIQSKVEVKELAAQVVQRLATEILIQGFRIVEGRLENVRTFREQDGKTEHSVVTLRYLIDPI